ncbi:MAG: AI-2E family transporter [Chitinophagaceae bacterium]
MFNFNDRLKQILTLSLIILLLVLSLKELTIFLPGILGALTFYILSRANYFQLVYNKKWKKGNTAFMYIIYYLILLGIPIFLAITLVSPKVNDLLSDPTAVVENLKRAVAQVQQKVGFNLISEKSLSNSLEKAATYIPSILNSTANLITNLIIMLFFLYYMLYYGKEIEKTLVKMIPLKNENTNLLAAETKRLIRANALGIPLISIIQGVVATIGYFIFGLNEFGLWGFITGVFAFFPIVGTMIVWVPLVLYMFATGDTLNATGLLVYSVLITGNVDYVARITIMRRMGDVHPVVTVLGVIIGLGLFGFIGLIFGPLLVSYLIVLTKIYQNEFTTDDETITSSVKILDEEAEKKPDT